MLALGFDLYDEAARSRVEQLQWDLAQRLLANGVSVILENGFWSRAEREAHRSVAHTLGARTRLHYLVVPIDELERRIIARNKELPAEAVVDPRDLRAWLKVFEPPTAQELTARVCPDARETPSASDSVRAPAAGDQPIPKRTSDMDRSGRTLSGR
jgi:predicted kinase